MEGAEQFAHALEEAGVDVELKLYPGETHTSPLLENPMRGGQVCVGQGRRGRAGCHARAPKGPTSLLFVSN